MNHLSEHDASDSVAFDIRASFKEHRSVQSGQNNQTKDFRIDPLCFSALMEHMEESVCLLESGNDIRILYANSAFCRLTGYDTSSSAGAFPCPFSKLRIHPDDEEIYLQTLRQSLAGGSVTHCKYRIADSDGKWSLRQAQFVPMTGASGLYYLHPLVIEISADITVSRMQEQKIRESDLRLLVSLEQTPYLLWEVDIPRKKVQFQNFSDGTLVQNGPWLRFPEDFIDNDLVAPDSSADFIRFSVDLLQGSSEGRGNFILKSKRSDHYEWRSLLYRTLYDEDGHPIKAIGVSNINPSLPTDPESECGQTFLPDTLRRYLLLKLRADLTSDRIEEFWIRGTDMTNLARQQSYSRQTEAHPAPLFSEKDIKAADECFSRDLLIRNFQANGPSWFSRDFRRVTKNGEIQHVSATVRLYRNQQTGHIHLLAFLQNTNVRRRWEKALNNRIGRDKASGLYDADTEGAIMRKQLAQGKNVLCAVAVLQITGTLRNGPASDSQEAPIISLAPVFRLSLGADCAVGRFNDRQLICFFPDIRSEAAVRRRIEEAIHYVRFLSVNLASMDTMRFIAGVACEQCGRANPSLLISRAAMLCELKKNAATDTVVFPTPENARFLSLLPGSEEQKGQAVAAEELERSLSMEEQRAAFHCVTEMLASGSFSDSIDSVLRCAGLYYKASRVYVLSLTKDQRTVTMMHEWTAPGIQSIQQVMFHLPLSRFPILENCLKSHGPVILTPSAPEHSDAPSSLWHFTACPLLENDHVTGFLCIENSREHPSDVALLSTLIPYMLRERYRFQDTVTVSETVGKDALTGMANMRSYLNVLHNMDSDSCDALGVVILDIPGLSPFSDGMGEDYTRKMLIFVSEVMAEIFQKAHLYRTWETEFVVLCPDITYEVFTARCVRLRTALQRRYPQRIRVGYTWSDKFFTARRLVEDAAAIMRCDPIPQDTGYWEDLARSPKQRTMMDRFTVYFQPKTDMRTGELIGAEALVRGLDQDGDIVPPGRFIEEMERDGSIRELDFGVLEQTLSFMEQWREKGYPLPPVSINISRLTLFGPTTPASMLALLSRHPDISPSLLRLEITETAGNVESATLNGIMENFRAYGLEFSLDDFGSRYANLSMFSNSRFSEVKLDRSLVSNLPGNEISVMMVENIVKICKSSGTDCIAEGVETREQISALLSAGCCYAQGYYYDHALSAPAFENKYLRPRQAEE